MITAYTPTFGNSVLHLANIDSFGRDSLCRRVQSVWLPVMGALSDRIGRRPLLLLLLSLCLLQPIPRCCGWCTSPLHAPADSRTLAVFIYAELQRRNVVLLNRNHAD